MTGNETASRQAVRDDRKVRVQRRTGELMWRMSGRRNDRRENGGRRESVEKGTVVYAKRSTERRKIFRS
jgi:hypothetical protein